MHNKIRYYVFCSLSLLLIGLLPGCRDWFNKDSSSVTQEQTNFKVISVNDAETHNDASIAGSIHIPFEKFDNLGSFTQSWPKNTPMVVYCTNYECTASKIIAKKLKELGFIDVKVYSGGVAEWYQLAQKDPSYKVVGPQTQEYLKKEMQPSASITDVPTITAQELHDRMKDAGLIQ